MNQKPHCKTRAYQIRPSILQDLELNPNILGQKRPRRGDFASITSNWFIGCLLLKFAYLATDYQSLTIQFLRLSVFIIQLSLFIDASLNAFFFLPNQAYQYLLV